jgi:hypothetical protein
MINKKIPNFKSTTIDVSRCSKKELKRKFSDLDSINQLVVVNDPDKVSWVVSPLSRSANDVLKIPEPLIELPKLRSGYNSLTTIIIHGLGLKHFPKGLNKMIALEHLDLSRNNLDLRQKITVLKSINNLKRISIIGNQYDSTEVKAWQADNPQIIIDY